MSGMSEARRITGALWSTCRAVNVIVSRHNATRGVTLFLDIRASPGTTSLSRIYRIHKGMDKEPKVLDYHDVLLYRSDIDLLTGDKWLNDQIVSFFFEYLQLEKYARLKDIFFCGGSLSFLLLHGDPLDMEAMVAPLKLRERELVLFACNDNPDPSSAGGGSHWSLLTYTKQDSTFRHYNSAMGLNEEAATGLATNAWNLLGSGKRLKYRNVYTPQQNNSYDCGLYMLGTADIIAESYSKGLLGVDAEVGTRLTPDAVHKMRSHILDLIMERAGKASNAVS